MKASARSNTLRLSRRDFTAGLRWRPHTGIFLVHRTSDRVLGLKFYSAHNSWTNRRIAYSRLGSNSVIAVMSAARPLFPRKAEVSSAISLYCKSDKLGLPAIFATGTALAP